MWRAGTRCGTAQQAAPQVAHRSTHAAQRAAQQAISGPLTIVLARLNNEGCLGGGLGQHKLAGGDHICRPRGGDQAQAGRRTSDEQVEMQ